MVADEGLTVSLVADCKQTSPPAAPSLVVLATAPSSVEASQQHGYRYRTAFIHAPYICQIRLGFDWTTSRFLCIGFRHIATHCRPENNPGFSPVTRLSTVETPDPVWS